MDGVQIHLNVFLVETYARESDTLDKIDSNCSPGIILSITDLTNPFCNAFSYLP
jgi:hypothetical protein